MPSPEVQAIIDAWLAGDFARAIALTNQWQRSQQKRVCKGVNPDGTPCTVVLAPQARGWYCKKHRHQDPKVKAAVKRSRSGRV